MVKRNLFLPLLCLFLLSGCFKSMPEYEDGSLNMAITLRYTQPKYNIDIVLDSVAVKVTSIDYIVPSVVDTTDSNGTAYFHDLPWSQYKVVSEAKEVMLDFGDGDVPVLLTADTLFTPEDEDNVFSMKARLGMDGLKINEIYTCGPPNNFFFFYDQYFELYNSSKDTIYLDGMIFCRMGSSIESVTSIFQFPGEPLIGREFPVSPDSFVVLAVDANNFRDEVFDGEKSVDLSHADWEFVNAADPGDVNNNPDVPNISNIEVGEHREFLVGLNADCLILADGSDINYFDGIDPETVVDCVEYSSISDHIKQMPADLDKGWAGIGQIKYSGSSLERRMAGFDTNNSTFDFVIIPAPTPGYQH